MQSFLLWTNKDLNLNLNLKMTDIFVRLSVRQQWPSWTAWWMLNLSAHQVTMELISIDSLTRPAPPPQKKKHGVVTNLTNLRRKIAVLKHFQSIGGILDAIFRMTQYRRTIYLFMWFFFYVIWRPFWTPWWILDYLITRWQSNWS